MSEYFVRVVPFLMLIVYTIFVVHAYTLITPNYVLIQVDPDTHAVSNYAVMFMHGGCQQTIDDLTALGIDKTHYTCVRITNIKP